LALGVTIPQNHSLLVLTGLRQRTAPRFALNVMIKTKDTKRWTGILAGSSVLTFIKGTP